MALLVLVTALGQRRSKKFGFNLSMQLKTDSVQGKLSAVSFR